MRGPLTARLARRLRELRHGLVDGTPLFSALRLRWHRRRGRMSRLAEVLTAAHGDRVRSGPFSGMTYPLQKGDLSYLPRLVGAYESELHPHVEEAIGLEPSLVVVIGAGDGYYAVGFARRLRAARVVAFEAHPTLRSACRHLAEVNGVSERIRVSGRCAPDDLDGTLAPGALVFVDCEGCEVDLLDPNGVPALLACDLIVELHEFLRPGVGRLLRERFAPTHDVLVVDGAPSDPGRYPVLEDLDPRDARFALDELRPGPMEWTVMHPRSPGDRGRPSSPPADRASGR